MILVSANEIKNKGFLWDQVTDTLIVKKRQCAKLPSIIGWQSSFERKNYRLILLTKMIKDWRRRIIWVLSWIERRFNAQKLCDSSREIHRNSKTYDYISSQSKGYANSIQPRITAEATFWMWHLRLSHKILFTFRPSWSFPLTFEARSSKLASRIFSRTARKSGLWCQTFVWYSKIIPWKRTQCISRFYGFCQLFLSFRQLFLHIFRYSSWQKCSYRCREFNWWIVITFDWKKKTHKLSLTSLEAVFDYHQLTIVPCEKQTSFQACVLHRVAGNRKNLHHSSVNDGRSEAENEDFSMC